MSAPTFQHRHYVLIAHTIAALPEEIRAQVATRFANDLRGTNPSYDFWRFFNAAMGNPDSRRDR